MNARHRLSLISNSVYIPPPARADRIRSELGREWRTAKTIARQILSAPSREAWFIAAAVVAGAVVGGIVL